MEKVINYENFNVDNIKLSVEHKKYLYYNETYQFQKIIPKYIYGDGTEDDIYIQIPEVFSYGIKTFENSDQPPTHTFSFVIDVKPDEENEIDEAKAKEMTEKIIKIFDQILEKFKSFLCEENTIKKLGSKNRKLWNAVVDGIKPFLSYQIDKNTNDVVEGSVPTLFTKLKIETDKKKKSSIKSIFRQYNANTNMLDEISPSDLPDSFQNVRCTATGVIHIESIYIPKTNSLSIVHKLHEVLITDVMKKNINRIQLPQRLLKKKVDKIYDSDDEDNRSVHSVHSDSSRSSLEKATTDPWGPTHRASSNENVSKPIVKKVVRRLNNMNLDS
jgi:hypothetical protein